METTVNKDLKSALEIVNRTLAADYGCDEEAFQSESICFCLAPQKGARGFDIPGKFLAVLSMGRGVVVSCTANRLRWAQANLGGIPTDRFYFGPAIAKMQGYVARAGQVMAGPDLKYVCTLEDFRRNQTDVEVELVEGSGVAQLYPNSSFPNALGRADNPLRPTMIVALTKYQGAVVGMAAAKADSDLMWQVGVDMIREHRGKGIAKALVSRLTERILERGKVPYYSTWISNIGSQRTARSVGYTPVWAELYSRTETF
jgi:GNAT superfamily N-acetyltransferase